MYRMYLHKCQLTSKNKAKVNSNNYHKTGVLFKATPQI